MEHDIRFNIKLLCRVYNIDLDTMFQILMKCYLIDRNNNPYTDSKNKIIKEENEYYITDDGLDVLFSNAKLYVDRKCLTEKNEEVDNFLRHCINRAIASMNNKDRTIEELQADRRKYDLFYRTLLSIRNTIDQILYSNFSTYNNRNLY